MILILCIDEKRGMSFHHRRQSKDRVIREKIKEETESRILWMNGYSFNQFEEENWDNIQVDEAFMEKARPGEYCFVENLDVTVYMPKIEQIIIFYWNRRYPGDLFFEISFKENGWKLKEQENFTGFSHEKITKEVYVR